VLRFGAYDQKVLERLRWMSSILGPALAGALRERGRVDLKVITSQGLQMGDECDNRNVASTSLFTRLIAPALVRSADSSVAGAVLDFLRGNDHFYLNLSMAACKSTLDAACGYEGSTVVTAMARNGVEFGIRLSGTGDQWFTTPVPVPEGLYFVGYGPADANPDLGDSSIFIEKGGRGVIITSPACMEDAVDGRSGTWIVPDAGPVGALQLIDTGGHAAPAG